MGTTSDQCISFPECVGETNAVSANSDCSSAPSSSRSSFVLLHRRTLLYQPKGKALLCASDSGRSYRPAIIAIILEILPHTLVLRNRLHHCACLDRSCHQALQNLYCRMPIRERRVLLKSRCQECFTEGEISGERRQCKSEIA